VLLPSLDERVLTIPKYGEIAARDGFAVIATQNPREFVATSHLSEALRDRFELITLEYQNADEEADIVALNLPKICVIWRKKQPKRVCLRAYC